MASRMRKAAVKKLFQFGGQRVLKSISMAIEKQREQKHFAMRNLRKLQPSSLFFKSVMQTPLRTVVRCVCARARANACVLC